MKKLFGLFTVLIFIFSVIINGQQERIKIWPNLAPGTENKPNEEKIEDNRIKNVYQPEIEIFIPLRLNEKHAAVLIFPGGGYTHLAYEKEGTKIAQWLNDNGIAAFVLKYRLNIEDALSDAQRALSFVRYHAHKYNVEKYNIGVIGFSAGGHLAANLISHSSKNKFIDSIDSTNCNPDFAILIYGWLQEMYKLVSEKNPPTFLIHASDDSRVPVEQSINYCNALIKNGIQTEMHIYENGGHGFGLGIDKGNAGNWTNVCLDWMKQRNIIK